jgi:hypothetical protein
VTYLVPTENRTPTTDEELRASLLHFTQRACEVFAGSEMRAQPFYDRWVLDNGYFRPRPRLYHVAPLEKIEGFIDVSTLLQSHGDAARHIGQPVGTAFTGGAPLSVPGILHAVIDDQVKPDGTAVFSLEVFERSWQSLQKLLSEDQIEWLVLAPLRRLSNVPLPLELAPGVSIVQFNEYEVEQLAHSGTFASHFDHFGISQAEAVGLRISMQAKKCVGDFNVPPEATRDTFGHVHIGRQHALLDEVLSVLRLVDCGTVGSPGFIGFSPVLRTVTMFVQRPSRGFWTERYQPSASQLAEIRDLWTALSSGVTDRCRPLEASLHRFHLALDRFNHTDMLVDLMIAAEALFLSDTSDSTRGELKFRLALRAAKLVKLPKYDERSLYRLIRRAYDLRSEVVHSGRISEKSAKTLEPSGGLHAFVDEVTRVLRVGIRTAIDLTVKNVSITKPDFWELLVFSGSSIPSNEAEGSQDDAT